MKINNLIDKFLFFWPFNFSPMAFNVVFELTYLCNLNCSFCYLRIEENKRKLKQKKILSIKETFKIIDKIPNLASISFTGGEIFTIKDILKILKYAKKKHRVGFISNLTLNNIKTNQELVNLNIDAVMFSIDGKKTLHNKIRGDGCFEKTINNVAQIQKIKQTKQTKKPIFTMNTVIMPENVNQLGDLVKLAYKLRIDNLNFQLLDPSINRSGYQLFDNLDHLDSNLDKITRINKKRLELSLKNAISKAQKLNLNLTFSPSFKLNSVLDYYQAKVNLKNFYCSKIFTSTRISPYGEMYPCFNLKMGNLLKNNFFKLFNSSKYQKFRQQIKKGTYKGSCVGCCHYKLKDNL